MAVIRSDFARESFRKGWVRSVLIVLNARGLIVSDAVRNRVESCTDPDQLLSWLYWAANADSLEDVFG